MLISSSLWAEGGPFRPLFLFGYNVVRFAAIYLLIAVSRDHVRLLQQMIAGFVGGTVVLTGSLLLLTDAPRQFVQTGRLQTDLLSATTFAPRTGVALLMLVAAPQHGRLITGSLRWGLIGLFVVVTIFAFGKTVILAAVACLFVWWWTQEGGQKLRTGLALAVGGISIVLLFGDELYARAISYIQNSNRLATLTGRTVLWSTVIEMGVDQPVFGYGYGLMDRYIWEYIPRLGWNERDVLGQAHNAVLDVFVKMGGVGLIAFFGVVGTGIRRVLSTVRATSSDHLNGQVARFVLTVVLFYLIRSLTEGAMSGGFDLLAFFAIVLLLGRITERKGR